MTWWKEGVAWGAVSGLLRGPGRLGLLALTKTFHGTQIPVSRQGSDRSVAAFSVLLPNSTARELFVGVRLRHLPGRWEELSRLCEVHSIGQEAGSQVLCRWLRGRKGSMEVWLHLPPTCGPEKFLTLSHAPCPPSPRCE